MADHGILIFADTASRWMSFRRRAYRNYEDTKKYRRRRREQFQRFLEQG